MAASPSTSSDKPKRAPTLYFIVLHHLAKGILLLLTSVGIFALMGHNLPDIFDQFLRWLHLDPANRFFADIGEQLDKITPANMQVAEMGTFLYGLIMAGAGIGLAFRAHWAVWLAIGEAAFFIPIEIFELVHHLSPRPEAVPHHDMFHHPVLGLLAVLAINVIVVIYLSINRHRIFKHH